MCVTLAAISYEHCGKPVVEASMGGTVVCPWCDCGIDRLGQRIIVQQPLARAIGESVGGTEES